ncbi:hypothetical protein, partial [uncultured Tateyamaria sp.]|uniref:hypothetical protein n=1 Tax=uncultured Tateyamaria sp. TaxID=455651 RepID=UPI002618BDE9
MRRLAHILSFLAALLLTMPGPNAVLAVPMAVSDASFAPIPPHPSTSTAQLTSSARAPPLSRISAHPEHYRINSPAERGVTTAQGYTLPQIFGADDISALYPEELLALDGLSLVDQDLQHRYF